MMTAVRQTVTVQADGRLEVVNPDLRAGTVADVIVLLPSPVSPPLPKGMAPTIAERLAALDRLQKSLRLTPEAADAWIREVRGERDAWRLPGDEEAQP